MALEKNFDDTRGFDKDSVGIYLDEIAKIPLLDAAREVELAKTIEAGQLAEAILDPDTHREKLSEDDALRLKKLGEIASTEELEWLAEEGQRAKQTFINSNLRLAVSLARKYSSSPLPLIDRVQEGNTGLIRAVEKFDYTKGYKFSTYATWWVRQAVTRGTAEQGRVVRLPVHVVEEVNQVASARRSLVRQLGHEPDLEVIAAELGKDVDRVLDLMRWSQDHVSLDMPIGDDGDTTLGDFVGEELAPGPEATAINSEMRERLDSLLDLLGEREADIIRSRYGLTDGRQHKLADIGVRWGLSAERVRQLEREAIRKLKQIAPNEFADGLSA